MWALTDGLRNLRRRLLRSALTTAGVAIGAAALVLLGALSEKFSRLVTGGRDFASGQITVTGAGTGGMMGFARGALLSSDQLRRLSEVPGVKLAAPLVMFPVADTPGVLPLTLAPQVFGIDPEALRMNRRALAPRTAHGPVVPEGPDDVVLGSQVARMLHAVPDQTISIRDRQFRVVGVLETTLTGPDSFVFMPFDTAQSLLLESDPTLQRLASAPGARVLPIATAAAVFWTDGEDPEVVAERIRQTLDDVAVLSPAAATRQIGRALAVMNSLILGSGIVALIVASLAVANTLFTAVVERRREIGIRRVVGATRGQVVAEMVLEAAALGLAGGVLGLLGGLAAVEALNGVTERMGAPVFLLTARLALAATLLPGALAALAGAWPAWRAARLAPVDAIRYA
jgi:putative ABC transport system permease protein